MVMMRRASIGTLMAVLLALGIAVGAPQVDAQEASDVTYAGAIDGGGTVQITLTADSSALARVSITDATFTFIAPDVPTRTVIVSRELYFVPPIGHGDAIDVTLPIDIGREARSSVRVVGTMTEDGFSGTATHRSCVLGIGCSDIATTTWSATERIDMPPGPDDHIFTGEIDGGGAIQVALSPDGEDVTWVSIRDLPAEECLPGDPPFDIDVFFDPPAPLDAFGAPLVQTTSNLQTLALSASRSDVTLDGHLVLNTFRSDCTVVTRWSATAVEPLTPTIASRATDRAPTSTPRASQLPGAGGGPRDEASFWLWLAALAALLGVAVLAIGRQR
jgi:hypothetical protein